MGLQVSITGLTASSGGSLVIATTVIVDTGSVQDLADALANYTALPESVYGSTLMTSGSSPAYLGDIIYNTLLSYVLDGNFSAVAAHNSTSYNATGMSRITSLSQALATSFEGEQVSAWQPSTVILCSPLTPDL